ncbi:hypothetical protein H4582DRAFT_56434 [Lactarius indigo]|nr:hypothetical protein H4582DRAFT_56434 [Lactarius indigo]
MGTIDSEKGAITFPPFYGLRFLEGFSTRAGLSPSPPFLCVSESDAPDVRGRSSPRLLAYPLQERLVNDFLNHPDFRLFASFSLGWVFLSSLHYIWMSAFVRDLAWIFIAAYGHLRGKANLVTPTGPLREKSPGENRPSSVRTAELYRLKQLDTLNLLLSMAFLLASLSSFLSLLLFSPSSSGAACGFVIALSAIASQAARVFGLFILGLDLRHKMPGLWEPWTFWSCLALVTVLNGVAIGLGPGRLITPLMMPSTSLCFRKRFLSTSLVGSILNIVLELYILIRILSLVKPPRLKCATIQDTLVVQAGSLLLFDLLVIVPEAIPTGVIAEFIPFSIGALTVLVAFHSTFGQSASHSTQLDGPDLTPRTPTRIMVPPEPPILRCDTPNGLIRIENHPSPIALAVDDIEAVAETPLSPRAARQSSLPSNAVVWETSPVAPLQPVEVSVQTAIAHDVSPVTQLGAGDLLRKEKILSYSSPIWATFGAQGHTNIGALSRPQILIETRSPPSSNPSLEQDGRVGPSPSSTVLGSDIIRCTPTHRSKDRTRIRHSAPPPALSPTSPIPSLLQLATHQSRASSISMHPPNNENKQQLGPILPKETTQWLSPTTSRSSKSRQGSKSSISSRRSKSSMRSAKAAVITTGEGSFLGTTVFRAVSSRLSRGFPLKNRHTRPVGVVRGPRPSPSASRKGKGYSEGQ